jgi:hypothetical protein
MALFYFHFAGRDRDTSGTECGDLATARNTAVQQLGAYLASHPDYAAEGHWRVTVEDANRRALLNVIIATVPARGAPVS